MDLGFETIGNATLICFDREPVLVTDPWILGSPYFGSWTLSHEIPEAQLDAIRRCRYVWVSHGHPDHLSGESLRLLAGAKVLLPDHVGNRIADALTKDGYEVTVLTSRRWYPLSDRLWVMSIADYNQDGVLLVSLGDRLVVNLNDAFDRGWSTVVKREVSRHKVSYLMRLSGFGDADMMNFFDEQGNRVPPKAAERKRIGEVIARWNHHFGTRYFIPFSSMHRYQRADSVWANEYVTSLDDHGLGFESDTSELLPAFLRVDVIRDRHERIDPTPREVVVHDPSEFGDDWDEPLGDDDRQRLTRYFKAISHLESHFDHVTFRVGGQDHVVELARRDFNRGITFDVPRTSLMAAVRWEIFDDLLIGNYMRTTVHGADQPPTLYPHFTPYVAKYADNGLARSPEELEAYFAEYRQRAPIEYLRHRVERRAMGTFRSLVSPDSGLYRTARRAYYALR